MLRRRFLQASALALGAAPNASAGAAVASGPRPRAVAPPRTAAPRRKIAIVCSVFHYLSHAYHIGQRFLHGYLRDGKMHYPDFAIAGMYVDQPKHPSDLSVEYAKDFGFPLFDRIDRALTLGTDRLAVDGVLVICEHGSYPRNERWQIQYPRFEMMQQVFDVMRKSERVVPLFNDKHLSYDRKKARALVETAARLKVPFMAGSSLPVTWRRPEIDVELGAPLREAMVVSSGDVDIYGFHALESLQCLVERRMRGGQQGVRSVQCLVGDDVWKAGDAGIWSWDLLEHCLARSHTRNAGDVRRNCREYWTGPQQRILPRPDARIPSNPAAFLIEYRDGLKATVLMLNGHVADITFAARIEGRREPLSTLLYLPGPPGAAFLEALTSKIEDFLEGRPPYPVERTLLTSSILDVALESRVSKQAKLETPDLDVSYAPPADSGYMRGNY